MKRTVFETPYKNFRILEIPDETSRLEDLKGCCFDPEANPDTDPEVLKRDEIRFEKRVEAYGIFGYVLERWNPEPGVGYETIDSCWGFVGEYVEGAEGFDHYIVDEMKASIKEGKT